MPRLPSLRTARRSFVSTTLTATLVASLAACADPAASPGEPGPDAGVLEPDAAQPLPAAFRISLVGERLPILAGGTATVEVRVDRAETFAGAVTVTVDHLPAGVSADALTIGAGSVSGTLTLRAAATAAHSLPTAVGVRGQAVGGEDHDVTAAIVTVIGTPGALDTSFGATGGKVVVPAGISDDTGLAVAVQPDGKVLIAGRAAEHLGDFALVRLERDGALDATFGTGGRVLTDLAGAADAVHAIALQPDGKIVVAGVTTTAATGNDFAVARYLPDGRLDASFGTGGTVITAVGPDADAAYAIALQADGKIVVGGDSSRGASQTGVDYALVRYTATGALDAGFGTGGVVLTPIAASGGRDSIYALATQFIDGEERIVAAGGEGDFSAARYRATGALDASFGSGGKVARMLGSTIGAARAIAIGPNNVITLAGHGHHDVALAQLTVGGTLDVGFGAGGTTITKLSVTNWDEAQALVREPDGGLVVAGWVYEGGSSAGNFAVLRYGAAGALDARFGTGGTAIIPVAAGSKADQAMAVTVQPDDRVPTRRIVAAGWASDSNTDLAVIRVWQ